MLRVSTNRISGTSGMKSLVLMLCVFFILVLGIGTTVSYLVTGTPTLVNLFLNGMHPDGDLVIQKTVSHPYGDAYSVPGDISFTFEVDLGTEYAGETIKTSQGKKTADENGIIFVSVLPGGRSAVYDIDEGTVVTVTETNIGEGFVPDAASREITVQKHQDNVLNFMNTYSPKKADTSALTISGVKSLTGREWIKGDSFTFDFSIYRDGVWSSLGTQTITYEVTEQPDSEDSEKTVFVPKPDFNKLDFSGLIRACVFDKAGTYSFCVSEVEENIGGILYDKAESRFDIVVGDADMDGYLEIQSVTAASANTCVDGMTINMVFENKYAPAGSAEAVIEIQKNLQDTSGQNKSTAGFTFELYDKAGTLLRTSEPTGATGETFIRLVYGPEAAGKTFSYVLKETGSGERVGAYTYDDRQYAILVSVADKLDGTVAAYVYNDDSSGLDGDIGQVSGGDAEEVSGGDAGPGWADNEVSGGDAAGSRTDVLIPAGATNCYQAVFANLYDPVDASVVISGKKYLDGRKLNAGEFAFCLYQTNNLFEAAGNAWPVDRTLNDAEGVFRYQALSYDKVGTYYYVAAEAAENKLDGVTYDESRYLVTVVVTDRDGILKAEVSVTDAYGKECDIAFYNSYHAAPVSMPIKGKKILNGAKLLENAFQFNLFVADENFNAGEKAFLTAANDEKGFWKFEDLTFANAGTYRYVVTEQIGTVEGMVYDDTVYCVTVDVTDPGDGQLEVSGLNIMADGQPVSEILFENTYVEPVKPDEPDEPDEPTGPDESEDVESPETGDDSNILLYAVAAALCAAVLILLWVIRRRRK